MPAYSKSENSYFDGSDRNYTMMYTTEDNTYSAKWVAYPLASGHTGGSNSASWKKTPDIDVNDQINVWDGSYGVDYAAGNTYARGHQIPNADRKNIATMQSQTYYATNSTPQIQNGFNGGIWSTLEGAIRDAIPANDSLYIATGPVYKTAGGEETVTTIQPKYDSKSVAVPNYYYKVVLKVKRNVSNEVTSAMAIGFWLEHKVYSGTSYTAYATSVDDIEAKTGFNFFANLPTTIEEDAEANKDWSTFTSF